MCPRAFLPVLALIVSPLVAAQSFCSSDRLTQPAAVLERVVGADCDSCWADDSARARPNELALDWIGPGSKGEDAPLAAAATRDALARLAALQRTAPATFDLARQPVQAPKRGLRVSIGPPFNDYVGTSIELKPPGPDRWSAWLLLVETIPAGTEGTPIERNLVRNALQLAWGAGTVQPRLFESRSMSIPPGARPERLRVVGWVEDGRGRMRAIAQSRCPATGPGGSNQAPGPSNCARFFFAPRRWKPGPNPSAHLFDNSLPELGKSNGNLRLRQRPAVAAQMPRREPVRMRRQRGAGRAQLPHPGGTGQHEDGGGREDLPVAGAARLLLRDAPLRCGQRGLRAQDA
jgi:hypothetical protein